MSTYIPVARERDRWRIIDGRGVKMRGHGSGHSEVPVGGDINVHAARERERERERETARAGQTDGWRINTCNRSMTRKS